MTWALATISLLATWLNTRRVRACFAIWFVTNIAWATFNFNQGIYARGVLDAVYAGLAVYGWRKWSDSDE